MFGAGVVRIFEELRVSPKLKWGAGLVLFLGLLVVSWFALNKRYDADVTPESYSYVERFEKEGIARGRSCHTGDEWPNRS